MHCDQTRKPWAPCRQVRHLLAELVVDGIGCALLFARHILLPDLPCLLRKHAAVRLQASSTADRSAIETLHNISAHSAQVPKKRATLPHKHTHSSFVHLLLLLLLLRLARCLLRPRCLLRRTRVLVQQPLQLLLLPLQLLRCLLLLLRRLPRRLRRLALPARGRLLVTLLRRQAILMLCRELVQRALLLRWVRQQPPPAAATAEAVRTAATTTVAATGHEQPPPGVPRQVPLGAASRCQGLVSWSIETGAQQASAPEPTCNASQLEDGELGKDLAAQHSFGDCGSKHLLWRRRGAGAVAHIRVGVVDRVRSEALVPVAPHTQLRHRQPLRHLLPLRTCRCTSRVSAWPFCGLTVPPLGSAGRPVHKASECRFAELHPCTS